MYTTLYNDISTTKCSLSTEHLSLPVRILLIRIHKTITGSDSSANHHQLVMQPKGQTRTSLMSNLTDSRLWDLFISFLRSSKTKIDRHDMTFLDADKRLQSMITICLEYRTFLQYPRDECQIGMLCCIYHIEIKHKLKSKAWHIVHVHILLFTKDNM